MLAKCFAVVTRHNDSHSAIALHFFYSGEQSIDLSVEVMDLSIVAIHQSSFTKDRVFSPYSVGLMRIDVVDQKEERLVQVVQPLELSESYISRFHGIRLLPIGFHQNTISVKPSQDGGHSREVPVGGH